jgi:hypothetical protein
MAFVVQGDVPVTSANAYVDATFFVAYHTDRGTDVSSYSTTEVQFAIVRATQYLDVRFEYIGERVLSNQELEWPRQFAYDDRGNSVTGLPVAVKWAVCEYALRALTAALMADPAQADDSGRSVKVREEAVGPIVEKIEYERGATYSMPDYPIADRMLVARGLVSSGAAGGSKSGLMVGTLSRG